MTITTLDLADQADRSEDARRDWVKRFAYRAMLCTNGLDTESAMLIAAIQYANSAATDPEAAAESYSGAPTVLTERRRSPETRRVFGTGRTQGVATVAVGAHSASSSNEETVAEVIEASRVAA